jgi:hypothetical protein
MKGKSIEIFCLDMPDERPWSSTTLWWLIVDISSEVLITTTKKKWESIHIGLVWVEDFGRDVQYLRSRKNSINNWV